MEITLQAKPTYVETDKQTEKRLTIVTNYYIYGFLKNILNRNILLDLFCFESVINLWYSVSLKSLSSKIWLQKLVAFSILQVIVY